MLSLQFTCHICSVERTLLFELLRLPLFDLRCRFDININVKLGCPSRHVIRLFLMDMRRYFWIGEGCILLLRWWGVLMLPYSLLGCKLFVKNTQCVDKHEHDREDDRIESVERLELAFPRSHNFEAFLVRGMMDCITSVHHTLSD